MVTEPDLSSSKGISATGRKGSKKVRTGCITCKLRKVKCDEVKPFCMRCTGTGRKCDGYLNPQSIGRSRRRASGQAPRTSLFFIYEWASEDEKRSFHFFQHVTAPTLSGDFDAFFWRVLVLQICQTEPAVKHAVLAVSSLHEGMLQETHTVTPYTDGSSRQSFALQQYNKAIACILDQMTDADANPLCPLLTCVLFVCIEIMQNKDNESLLHLEQGRQILAQLNRKASSTDPEMDMIKQHLVPMYTRLSLTSFMFGGNPVPIPLELKTLRSVPSVFESIDEAQYSLYDFMDECMRFTRRTRLGRAPNVPREAVSTFRQQQDYLVGKLAKIDVAWSLYQASHPADAQEGAAKLLSIHLRLNRVCVSMALSTDETDFDSHLADFAAIISLASAFLEASGRNTSTDRIYAAATGNPVHPSGPRSTFSFGIHVIAPLYYVATKCRHPVIRGTALDLLKLNSSRRENLWRANIMAEIAARTIKLEEESALPARSMSPPHHQIPEPFSHGVTPELIWATSLADSGIPRLDLGQAAEHLNPDPWFDLRPNRVSDCTSLDTSLSLDTYSIPSLAGDSIPGRANPDMAIDPTLVSGDTARSSLSFASPFDHFSHETGETSSNLYFGPTSMPATTSNLAWEVIIPSGPAARGEDEAPSDQDKPSSNYSGTTGQRNYSGLGSVQNSTLSREAPFDLPEHVRVHDVIIGPEKEDGSWIMMFRKLGGVGADWDVTTEFVAI